MKTKSYLILFLLVVGCCLLLQRPAAAQEYEFTIDWFSSRIPTWEKILARFQGEPGVHYLEVGVYEGRSAFWMIDNILTHATARMTVIDPFGEDYEERFLANLKVSGAEDRVTVIKGFSQTEMMHLAPDSFDIIYIDGSHMAHHVWVDAVLCWPLLKRDGLLIFDDYLFEKFDAKARERQLEERPRFAIDTFLMAYRSHLEIIHADFQVVVRKKTSSNGFLFLEQSLSLWRETNPYRVSHQRSGRLTDQEKAVLKSLRELKGEDEQAWVDRFVKIVRNKPFALNEEESGLIDKFFSELKEIPKRKQILEAMKTVRDHYGQRNP